MEHFFHYINYYYQSKEDVGKVVDEDSTVKVPKNFVDIWEPFDYYKMLDHFQ